MLDIIFISYDEPNADKNYAALKARFPHARRVHGIKGIANAHMSAAKKSMTKFFYVVDADAVIAPTFDFSYKPGPGDEEFVHVWYAYNPAIGISYGYGGVKLFNKAFFKNVESQLDFTTTLTKDIKVIPEIACTTAFNSDGHRAFRGAFREVAKLYSTICDEKRPSFIRKEAMDRLDRWFNPLIDCAYRSFIVEGARQGVEHAKTRNDLSFINDHDLMINLLHFDSIAPEVDRKTDPTPQPNHPMRKEFFFTSRIASAFYDDFVLNNVPITEIRDAISDGQILSKLWLTEQLRALLDDGKMQKDASVAILGGWIGTLSLMFNAYQLPIRVTSIDLDGRANIVAQKLNYDFAHFQTMDLDMYNIDYEKFDVIINTSSEHIPDIPAWREKIPDGKIIIVQNNNYLNGDGHVSCVDNSDELRRKLNLSEVFYEGTRKFPVYERYMLIGRT